MKRWKHWTLVISFIALVSYIYALNAPRQRTVTVGSSRITLTVKGYSPAQSVTEVVDGRKVEYRVNGDKVITVLMELIDGSMRSEFYNYTSDGWTRLTTEHRPGGWPGWIRSIEEDEGLLPPSP